MSVTPEKDPNYIYAHPYATLIADEYRMRGGYFSRRFRRAYGLPPREIAKRPPTKARRGL